MPSEIHASLLRRAPTRTNAIIVQTIATGNVSAVTMNDETLGVLRLNIWPMATANVRKLSAAQIIAVMFAPAANDSRLEFGVIKVCGVMWPNVQSSGTRDQPA
jgi:hypothetical protein